MSARLLIAGVSSGVGKTSFTLGLCAALRRRQLAVSVFKCGPDYLDPTYHRAASERPVHNLDSWLMSERTLAGTLARHSADVSLIEGVMGLYDGLSPTSLAGSSAEVALRTRTPVLLVCEAAGMARSVAALAQGFARFEPGLDLRALICNRVGSRGHLELLRQACSEPAVLGGLPKQGAPSFPERHLGLHSARELDLSAAIAAWGELVESWCDLDALLALARSAPDLPSPSEQPPPAASGSPRRCTIAVADDAAFHFYYDANLEALERAGATLLRFSPIADASPGDVDGVYIGGGYPELHARELAENQPMLSALRRHAASGRPLYAECGGLMYLSEGIATLDGTLHPMLGLVAGTAIMSERLQALGYVQVETRDASPLGPAGTRFRGHQFRYSRFESALPPARFAASLARTGTPLSEGYGSGNVLASYVHAHWADSPEIPAAFVDACVAARATAACAG